MHHAVIAEPVSRLAAFVGKGKAPFPERKRTNGLVRKTDPSQAHDEVKAEIRYEPDGPLGVAAVKVDGRWQMLEALPVRTKMAADIGRLTRQHRPFQPREASEHGGYRLRPKRPGVNQEARQHEARCGHDAVEHTLLPIFKDATWPDQKSDPQWTRRRGAAVLLRARHHVTSGRSAAGLRSRRQVCECRRALGSPRANP